MRAGQKQTIGDEHQYLVTSVEDPNKERRKATIDDHLQAFGNAIGTSLQELKTKLHKVATDYLPENLFAS